MSLVISFQGCRWIQNRNSRNLHSKWRLLGLLGYGHALWSLPCGLMSGVTLYRFTMFLNLSSLHSTGNWWCPFHATATITLFLFHSSLWCSFLSFCPCGRHVKCFFCSCFFFFLLIFDLSKVLNYPDKSNKCVLTIYYETIKIVNQL